ncbi:MAG: GntR family transcriptional regulator [Acidobacteria bacterium]|nr:GntR family transcriptional regulator [Acidobacteriota bacterium]MBI3657655.1 GntR family transcriptional regulator [Acidobacteriota bacterium]
MLKFTLEKRCSLSYHEQIKSQIISGLYTGKLREGDRLPSIREMSADLGINYKTVQKIYARLEQEEFLEVTRGSGVFIRRRTEGEFQELRRHAIVNLIKATLDHARRIGLPAEKFSNLLNNYVSPSSFKRFHCAVVDDEEEAIVFSQELERRIGIAAQPLPLQYIEAATATSDFAIPETAYLLTTSWHLEAVRRFADLHQRKVLELKPNPQVYSEIAGEIQQHNVAVVVNDARTIHASSEVFMNILQPRTSKRFFIATAQDTAMLSEIIAHADLIYVSPLCWDALRRMTPAHIEMRTFKDLIADETLDTLRGLRIFE